MQTKSQSQRSQEFIKTIAWVFIVMCGFGILFSLLQMLMFGWAAQLFATKLKGQQVFSQIQDLISYLPIFFGLTIVIFAIHLTASYGLLKLRNWARLLFIGALLVEIIMIILFGLVFTFWSAPPPDDYAQFGYAAGVLWFSKALNVLYTMLGSGLLGYLVWKLTKPEIRAEFDRQN